MSFSRILRALLLRLPIARGLRVDLSRSEEQCRRLGRKLRAARQRVVRLDTNRHRIRSARLSEQVVADVMPVRHQALLQAHAAERCAREAIFLQRSDSYASLRHVSDMPAAVKTTLNSLTWWIPSGNGHQGAIVATSQRERLPLREILATREVAIGRVMIDIGANVGGTSIPRVILGDFECVYAAEPHPGNYGSLVRNVIDNGLGGLVLPDRVAIGDAEGRVDLRCMSRGTHHLMNTPAVGVDSIPVRCTTLDAWVSELSIDLNRVRFIKSDTQGWDYRVLQGASHVLTQKHICWQVEVSPSMLRRSGSDVFVACELIRAHFSHFIDLRGNSGKRARCTTELPAALSHLESGPRSFTNLLLYNRAA